jgi:Pvc16 N-terminal domain/Carboxypeptidase regulatory-like domain
MSLVVQVSTNTMLADLDESLSTLLKDGLQQHGFDRVEIAFDAPSREWSGQLAGPAVNVFLYDLRESTHNKQRTIDERRSASGAVESRPPLLLDCSYALTAWTRSVEDEHRLLSQALAILYAFPRLPAEVLPARLRNGSQRYPITTKVGQGRSEGKADFWSAVGGQYKASIDYVVTLSLEPGTVHRRGPEVRESTIRIGDATLPRGATTELHRLAGRLADEHGEPQPGAWITMPAAGRYATTDETGRFRFDRVPPGKHICIARTAAGDEVETELVVPGATADLVVGAKPPRKRTS